MISNKWRGGPEDYLQSYTGVNVQKGIKRAGNDGLKNNFRQSMFYLKHLKVRSLRYILQATRVRPQPPPPSPPPKSLLFKILRAESCLTVAQQFDQINSPCSFLELLKLYFAIHICNLQGLHYQQGCRKCKILQPSLTTNRCPTESVKLKLFFSVLILHHLKTHTDTGQICC